MDHVSGPQVRRFPTSVSSACELAIVGSAVPEQRGVVAVNSDGALTGTRRKPSAVGAPTQKRTGES